MWGKLGWFNYFSVTIPRCYKDVYVSSSFFVRFWNSLTIECFPLTYDLNDFKSRINRHFLAVGSFETYFLYDLIFWCFFFLVTPCLIVAVQSCMEWIPFKKKLYNDNCCHCSFCCYYFSSILLKSHERIIIIRIMINKNTNIKSIVTWNVENVLFEKSSCQIQNFIPPW